MKGIVWIISSANLYIIKCNFYNNIAQFGSGIYLELKGMIYRYDSRIITIKDCNFFNNSAVYGSSIYFLEAESKSNNFLIFINNLFHFR